MTPRNSLKQLKHYLACALHEIKHSVHGLDANKALGFTLYFISISAMHPCFISCKSLVAILCFIHMWGLPHTINVVHILYVVTFYSTVSHYTASITLEYHVAK